jgi:hypothetical protein
LLARVRTTRIRPVRRLTRLLRTSRRTSRRGPARGRTGRELTGLRRALAGRELPLRRMLTRMLWWLRTALGRHGGTTGTGPGRDGWCLTVLRATGRGAASTGRRAALAWNGVRRLVRLVGIVAFGRRNPLPCRGWNSGPCRGGRASALV